MVEAVIATGRPPAAGHILPLNVAGLAYRVDGRTLIDDVSFRLTGGRRTVILGPNGAGKSLLLRLCHGLIRPSAGRIEWQSGDPKLIRRRQAMVFQRPVLLRRSAAANIAYALSVLGTPFGERRAKVEAALHSAGLAALAARSARVLSAGEQQRLAIARAWATRPEILFLDEPTANLDPAATRAVELLIDEIHRDGTKIVMTTHDLGQARRLADEVLFLDRGRLVELSPAAAFFEAPKSRAAAAFLAGELLH